MRPQIVKLVIPEKSLPNFSPIVKPVPFSSDQASINCGPRVKSDTPPRLANVERPSTEIKPLRLVINLSILQFDVKLALMTVASEKSCIASGPYHGR